MAGARGAGLQCLASLAPMFVLTRVKTCLARSGDPLRARVGTRLFGLTYLGFAPERSQCCNSSILSTVRKHRIVPIDTYLAILGTQICPRKNIPKAIPPSINK